MGFFSGLGSALGAVCSAVGSFCSSVGGAIMRGVASLAPVLAPHINLLCLIVSVLAEIFTEKPKEEKPEEIGMKAEKADKKPEDFDSINDYLEYLRKEVQVEPGDLEKLSEEDKMKYQLVGLGLYVKDIEERQELKLDPDFLKVVPKLKEQGYEAADIANLMQSMKKNGVTDMKQYVDFMKGDLQPGSPERQKMQLSVKDMVEQHFQGKEVNVRQEINKLADAVRE